MASGVRLIKYILDIREAEDYSTIFIMSQFCYMEWFVVFYLFLFKNKKLK